MTDALRFPAEWEAQSGVLIAWPHVDTDWAERLAEVEETYIALVAAITRFQPVVICVADDDIETYAEMRLRSNRIDMERVRFVTVEYDDTWLRDSGPLTLVDGNRYRLLDFRFTGWGGKFEASRDDQLVGALHDASTFNNAEVRSIPFALEGGAIDTDGAGTLLTTWQCLHERHPQLALLGELDVVVASAHSKLRMDATAMTRRLVAAASHPRVDVLGHVTGRLIAGERGTRPPSTCPSMPLSSIAAPCAGWRASRANPVARPGRPGCCMPLPPGARRISRPTRLKSPPAWQPPLSSWAPHLRLRQRRTAGVMPIRSRRLTWATTGMPSAGSVCAATGSMAARSRVPG